MLQIADTTHFKKVVEFARLTRQIPFLFDQLWYLNTFADNLKSEYEWFGHLKRDFHVEKLPREFFHGMMVEYGTEFLHSLFLPLVGDGDLNTPSIAARMVEGRRTVTLYSDFAVASFYWRETVLVDGVVKNGLEGGLIYHGDHREMWSGDYKGDPLSVRIGTPDDHNPWSVHT